MISCICLPIHQSDDDEKGGEGMGRNEQFYRGLYKVNSSSNFGGQLFGNLIGGLENSSPVDFATQLCCSLNNDSHCNNYDHCVLLGFIPTSGHTIDSLLAWRSKHDKLEHNHEFIQWHVFYHISYV